MKLQKKQKPKKIRVFRYCAGRWHEIGRHRECPKCRGREFVELR